MNVSSQAAPTLLSDASLTITIVRRGSLLWTIKIWKLPPHTSAIFLLMESRITSATWSLMVHLFIYWLSRKEKQLLKWCAHSLFSLHISRLWPGGMCLSDEQPRQIPLIDGTCWLLPVLSVLTSQAPRITSCFWCRGWAHGSQMLLLLLSHYFSSVQGQTVWLSLPGPGSMLATSPRGSFFHKLPFWRPDTVLGETEIWNR